VQIVENNARMSLSHLKLFKLKHLIVILDRKHETAAPETVNCYEYHIALFSHFSDNPIDMHCKLPKYSTYKFLSFMLMSELR